VTEQRKTQRFELKLPVEVVRNGHERTSVAGETKNLSSNGVLFQSSARVQVGEPVEYLITFPTSPGSNTELRLRCLGKVIRHAQGAEIAATLERYEFVRNGR
jgi:hypothetical protein